MQFELGQIVTSRRGRDTGHAYVVCGAEGEDRLLLANGEKRRLDAPKRKNIRHVNPTSRILPAGEMQTDRGIKRALAAFIEATAPMSGG